MRTTYPMELALHLAAAVSSAVAVVCALYLIPVSGKAKAWLLPCAAFILPSIDRMSKLMAHSSLPDALSMRRSAMCCSPASSCLFGGICHMPHHHSARTQH